MGEGNIDIIIVFQIARGQGNSLCAMLRVARWLGEHAKILPNTFLGRKAGVAATSLHARLSTDHNLE